MTDNENQTEANRLHILLIDDDELVGKSFKRLFRHDYETTAVCSAQDGLQLIATQEPRFDVILSDLSMPEMDGMEFFYQVEQSFPEMVERIIFISGGATTATQEQFLAQHRCRQLNKPFSATEIHQMISAVTSSV